MADKTPTTRTHDNGNEKPAIDAANINQHSDGTEDPSWSCAATTGSPARSEQNQPSNGSTTKSDTNAGEENSYSIQSWLEQPASDDPWMPPSPQAGR